MVRVIIIGGGIAGLAAAHFLSNYTTIDIDLYEAEPQIGGQASSRQTDICYTEYSWRIFGQTYHNLWSLIDEMGIWENFEPLRNTCFIEEAQTSDATLNFGNLLLATLQRSQWSELNSYLALLCQCPERLTTEYDDVNAFDYFHHHPIIKSILGPFLGMEANRVSLSGALKNIISVISQKKYSFTPPTTLLSKYPTGEALFVPWLDFLRKRGVQIHINSKFENLWVDPITRQIGGVTINGVNYQADEYLLACSLRPVNQIIERNSILRSSRTFQKMRALEDGFQLYFTINMYFSELISSSDECLEMVMVNQPWQPIIQKKRSWGQQYLNKCQINGKAIREVWNVGFLDYNLGNTITKRVGECTLTEAITEGISQVKNSQYFQQLLGQVNRTFEQVFLGHEHWYQFLEINQKLNSLNPKFSINVGIMKNMPTSQPPDLPSNLYLAGYYVQSTMGGVSMEASAETGLSAAKLIGEKYGLKKQGVSQAPIKHELENFTNLTWPLIQLDQYFYDRGQPPLISVISPLILILLYILIIVVFITYLITYLSKTELFSQLQATFFQLGHTTTR